MVPDYENATPARRNRDWLEIGCNFAFSDESSEGVELYYATRNWNWREAHYQINPLKPLAQGDDFDFYVALNYAVYFYVKIPEGYQLDTLKIGNSDNDYQVLPMSNGFELGEFAARQSEAMQKGCTYGFYFSDWDNLRDSVITITTKPMDPDETSDAYFYLKDPLTEGTAKTDYYYVGKGEVNYPAPKVGERYSVEDDKVTYPAKIPYPTIEKDGVKYTYDTTGAEGTYSVRWDVVKAEYGATTGKNGNQEIVPSSIMTWHVDGSIILHEPTEIPDSEKPHVDSVNETYDGKAHPLQIDEELFSKFDITYIVDGKRTTDIPSRTEYGTTNVTIEFASEQYQTYSLDVAITISKRELDITAGCEQDSKVYGEEDPDFYAVAGKNLAEGQILEATASRAEGEAVDTYLIKVDDGYKITDAAGNNVTENYKITVNTAEFEITKRPVTLTVANAAKTVGQSDPQFTLWEIDGLLEGHIIPEEVGLEFSRDPGESAGSYDINCVVKVINAQGDTTGKNLIGNYEPKVTIGTLTIHPAPVNPTPDPTPNPTPVPTPVPETPVIPMAPVTPADDGDDAVVDDGEDAEDIEDEETPQASPEATPAPEATAEPEEIEDDATAQAGVSGWALINLILMVLTVLAGLVMLGLRFAGKSGALHLIGVVPALVSLIAFFVTEDMSLPMVMTDRWTLIMALIAVVQIVLMVLGRHGQDNKDNANA